MSELGELSADAKSLVEHGRDADGPSADDKQRIKRRLAAELGAGAFVIAAVSTSLPGALPAASAGAPALAAPSTALHRLWQHTLVKAAVAASTVGALYFGAAAITPRPTPTAQRQSTVAAPAAPAQSAPAVEVPSAAEVSNSAVSPLAPMAPEILENKTDPSVLGEPARVGSAQRAARRSDDKGTRTVRASSTLGAELALIGAAQRALREHQPQRALELTQQHAARFADGSLSEERRGVEALAHCQLGQPTHASVADFLALAPRSPLAARVRKECAPR